MEFAIAFLAITGIVALITAYYTYFQCFRADPKRRDEPYAPIRGKQYEENRESMLRVTKIMDSATCEDVFITSKILPADIIAGKTAEGFDETLQKLGTDYVDLMLLHFPMLDEMNIAAWKTMVEYYRAGKARAIGISNYNERQMSVLLDNFDVVPAVNQFHIDPINNMQDRLDFCESKGIRTMASIPFGGTGRTKEVLEHPTIAALAEKLGKSTAQVVIRWNLQRGTIMIPKSVHKERIEANFNVFDFELSPEDMAVMESVNDLSVNRMFLDPEKSYDLWSGRIQFPFPKKD